MTPINPSDPFMRKIELALGLGHFIRYDEMSEFVEELESVKEEIEALVAAGEAGRATDLLEVFIAGCREKIEEVDDSGGNLGQCVESLFVGWIKARQAGKSEPSETVRCLLHWFDNDDYGLCNRIERQLTVVMDTTTLRAFREQIEERLAKEGFPPELESERSTQTKHWKNLDALKSILIVQKDEASYLALVNQDGGCKSKDCENLAIINQSLLNFDRALEWISKGLQISSNDPSTQFDLSRMKRELLVKLNRREEVIEDIWREFENRPSLYIYEELAGVINDASIAQWYAKALELIRTRAELGSLVDFCTKFGELQLLSEKIMGATDGEIEGLSSYSTEPAAEKLEDSYPRAAGRLYLADVIARLASKKSKAYPTALRHLEKLKQVYEKQGLHADWNKLVDALRLEHKRKSSFIDKFERIVSGKGLSREPTFAERIQKRLDPSRKSNPTE